MSTTNRLDTHSPGNIRPAEYTCVLFYALASNSGGWPLPPLNIDRVLELKRTEKFFQHPTWGSPCGKCSICGANFIEGEIWRHEPTGEHIHIGHTCSEKYGFYADASDFDAIRDGQRAERAKVIEADEKRKAREEFFSRFPGLEADLAVSHRIIDDIRERFNRFGS